MYSRHSSCPKNTLTVNILTETSAEEHLAVNRLCPYKIILEKQNNHRFSGGFS